VRARPSRRRRTLADRERRQAGRHAQALLGAGVPDVDPPVVGAQLDAADRGDRVDEQQRVPGLPDGGSERRDVGARARRRLGVDGSHDRGRGVSGDDTLDVDRRPPRVLDRDDLGPTA
jgi:hypothetical protein